MPGCKCNLSLTACIMKLGNRFQSSDVITQKCQLSNAVDFNKENRCRCQDQFPAKKPWACRVCVRHRKIDWDLLFICHSSSACLYASVDSLIIESQTHTQKKLTQQRILVPLSMTNPHTHWHQWLKQAQCVRQICPPCHIHPVPAVIRASRNFYITHSSIRPPATKFTVASGVHGD